MIHAYQEIYVNRVQNKLADTFDYAINVLNIKGEDFIKMFVVSNVSKQIEIGNPKYILGKSGIELLIDIVYQTTNNLLDIKVEPRYDRSIEYWIGYVIAYYVWYTNRTFKEIFDNITYEELVNMYYTLHEADISKFVDIMDNRLNNKETNLKKIRLKAGYTQSALAKLSNVSLRSIQMYEQRNKDINKASLETIYKLSKALNCDIESLIENANFSILKP